VLIIDTKQVLHQIIQDFVYSCNNNESIKQIVGLLGYS
jgi:hypothetical protein